MPFVAFPLAVTVRLIFERSTSSMTNSYPTYTTFSCIMQELFSTIFKQKEFRKTSSNNSTMNDLFNLKKYLKTSQTEQVLYHGSDSEEIVGKLYTGKRDPGWFGEAFYLTAYPEYAKRWGKHVYKMSIPPLKFAEVNVIGNYDNMEYLGDSKIAYEKAGGQNAAILKEYDFAVNFKKELKLMGYDGVRVHNDGQKDMEVAIFDPSNIKVLEKIS